MDTKTLLLERFAYLPDGTFGQLTMPDGTVYMTAERPWLDNKQYVSCIPEGEYEMGFRNSGTVARITNNNFMAGWEIKGVPGRSYILLHPGNWPSSVQGCIGLGKAFSPLKDPKSSSLYGVTSSQTSFRTFMAQMDADEQYTIKITGLKANLK